MSRLSVGFIRASLLYLLFGIALGLTMALPGGYSWLATNLMGQPDIAHAHANLLGFMVMMVMGVAYHIFPRFSGNPVKRPWMAWANFWLTQVGTAGLVTGFLVRGLLPWLVPTAAFVQFTGLTLFVVIMWQVVKPLNRLMV